MNLLKCVSHLTSVRNFSVTSSLSEIRKMARLRVVDNSNLGKQAMLDGKPPKCIHVYNKTHVGTIGDKILVAIKGLKKKAFIVGVRKHQKHMVPRHDSNNIVLLDDHGNPLGTRILVPIPSILRGRGEFSKIIALSSRFV
ncbi:large ribosomal subunit protein uL14m [Parasteatoda tepidariorum]|uniref:large ribosomal subunit protein uL14m n=1 Tax=Parasteatoda tepidariorum TaxID=114398 RepID=UPI00077FC935|nr:39S ribosomal protein L14, mitochondrial [Parasteatoda tepidariorum]